MKLPITKEWFEKRAAQEGDNEIGAGRRITRCINLTEEDMAELEQLLFVALPRWAQEELTDLREKAKPHWRCFHCEEVFSTEHAARLHFGETECQDPACQIKAGAEMSMLEALRRAENEARRAVFAMHEESMEGWKAFRQLEARTRQNAEAAENLGYERGLRDGREDAARFVDKRLHEYVSEHGVTDPDTGTVEYPGDGEEYVYELEEIAEGIRTLSTPTAVKDADHG